MTALKETRKHIRSIRKTQKILRAMKMVATVRLKRAQERLMATRPYALHLHAVMSRLAGQLTPEEMDRYPLMKTRAIPHRVMVIVMTSDKGLAGTFSSSVLRVAERFLWQEQSSGPPPAHPVERRRTRRFSEMQVAVIGRKAREHFDRQGTEVIQEHVGLFESLTYQRASDIARQLMQAYQHGDLHAAFIIYNQFKTVLSRSVVVEQVLPVVPAGMPVLAPPVTAQGDQVAFGQQAHPAEPNEPVFEPGLDAIMERLLPRFFAMQIFHAALESQAAEHAARMTAMDTASKNAGALLDRLTLQYNRARQAAITTELMEVIGGAEALRG